MTNNIFAVVYLLFFFCFSLLLYLIFCSLFILLYCAQITNAAHAKSSGKSNGTPRQASGTTKSQSGTNTNNAYRQKRQQRQKAAQEKRNQQQQGVSSGSARNKNKNFPQQMPMFPTPAFRPPSRHRPRRPPKTASGVTRRRRKKAGSSSKDSFGRNLDLEYRQRPSTAGGLGSKNFKSGSGLLQITPMFPDKASRAAVGDSVFNFSALPSKKVKSQQQQQNMNAGGGSGGNSPRRNRGGKETTNLGDNNGMQMNPRGQQDSGRGRGIQQQKKQSPRLSRGQIGGGGGSSGGGGGNRGGMQMNVNARGNFKPTAPGGGRGGRGGRGGQQKASPRMQRMQMQRNGM